MTYSIFRVEDVGSGRVVHYDDIVQLPPEPAEVFDVVSSVKHAGFPEEPCPEHSPLVQKVSHRVSVLQRKSPRVKN